MSVLEVAEPVVRPHQLPLAVGMAVACADVTPDGVRISAPGGRPAPEASAGVLLLVRRDSVPVAVLTAGPDDDLPALARAAPSAKVPRAATGALPTVSVLIPTAGRPDDLRRCLRSLAGQQHRPVEVVVVDNDPGDGRTRQVVAQVADETGLPLVLVEEPRRGSSLARNTGLTRVTGEIVALTDDDVVIDPGWAAALAAGFADPEVGCVTGLVMPVELETEAQVLFEQYGGFAKGVVPRQWRREPGPADSVLHPYACGSFGSGNNMAFRVSVLRDLDGFDTALGAGSPARAGADIEAFLRVLLTGSTLRYEPSALVWHKHRRGLDELSRQLNSYGSGLSAIGVKHLLCDPLPLLRRTPAALRFLLADSSSRNAGRCVDYPPELARAEVRGVLAGPWRYAKARWVAERDRHGLGGGQAALLVTTALNGVLGLAYWLLAARQYSTAEVGVAAAWVAALVPLATVGQLNYGGALQRFLPRSGPHAAALLRRGYLAAIPSCLLLGLTFLLLGPQALTGGVLGWLLVLSLPAWAVFSLQDTALLGIGRPWVVPVENAAYGIAKLVLLVLLAPLGGAEVVALSWVAPALVAVAVINVRLFTRLLPAHAARDREAPAVPGVTLRRFVGGDFAASLLGSLPAWGVPVLLVAAGEPESAAVWAAAMLVAQVVELAALALNGPLTVHLVRLPDSAATVLHRHRRRLGWLLVPYVLVAALAAPSLLRLFGETYEQGTTLLRVLLLASLARAAATTVAAVARSRSQLRLVVAVHALGGAVGLALAATLLPILGPEGAAVGLLLGWSTAAAYGIPALRRRR